ncbi:ras-associating and dilute domain-containing protein isoform X2 [Lingula anatina]|uniref:Ras-associating and dilute domain-containing protein isoform X2 n=1 Tax=Lingula anatina TaxID=7574 RepID=A0A1S3J2T1_LINAN|nr:ras-associating and dilute domain-containing protein isoform X2 [Lingula anatina]|eukprot:XP_013404586.1 ras-associating and dilute domain-containing protein isoform X2 [Lingula anatina]
MSQMSPSLLEELQKGNEAPGLFQSKRSNLNMLVNSQVLAHLQSLHEQAKEENEEVCEEGTTEEVLADREQLMERINNYNRRVALEAFKIRLVEETQDNKLDHIFEGVLRFYYARGQENLTKAVKLTNKTTVDSLLPELIEKFNINNHSDCSDSTHHLHVVLDGDEIRLEHEDTPLDLALNAKSTPRFVLRLASPEAMKEPQGEVTLADNEAIKVNENTDHEYGRRPSPDLTSGLANKSKSKYRDKTMITENGGKIEQIAEEKISGNKIGSRRHKRRSSKSSMEDENGHLDVESSPKSKSNGHPPQQGPAALLISMRRGRVKRDQSMERERTERGRSPSRERMRRSYRAAKDLLQRTFSLRKREDIKTQTELSVEECSPGVLKIFGDSICPGANYKSVLASTKSTAQELVKEALERYALPQSESSRYVLCDVVGKLSDVSIIDSENKVENVWTTECFRVIGDSERPLILQSLWKPTEGYSRRFEIRLREEVSLPGEVDNITSALNANARKMEIARTCPEAIPVEDIRKYSRSVSTSLLESQDLNCDANNEHNHTPTDDYNDSTKPLEFSWLDSHPPTAYPFLITLRGYNMLQDSLVYPLAEQVVMIGRGTDDARKTDISLHAPDVSLQHCWMIRNPTPSESDIVSVDPLADAFVAINNCPVSSLTNIKQGDLLSIGEHYVFLFKDPTTGEEIPRNVPWLTTKPDHAPAAGNAPHSAPADSESDTSSDVRTDMKSERKSRSKTRKRRDPRKDPKQTQRETEYKRDTTKLKLPFKQKKEDELLQRILHLCNTTDDIFPLCPAYLFVMAVDYYAMKFDKYIVRSLVQKIAGLVQQEAWNKTKLLADRHGELLSTQEGATDKDLFRDLRGIVYWMSNALEMLNFFKKNLPNMMMEPCDKLQARTRVAPEKVDEEMLAVLEEVVMYTFQQTVYYLTKALYVVLPAILDTNPFQDSKNENSSGQCPPTLQDILSIFQNTLDALKANLVHPHVVSQLFCYLFFFSNASLINWVMEKGKDGQYFQWIQGAQLRGNLDHIENWCNQSGFYEEGSSYLKKINMVSNLLAMPKVQLLQSDWYSLRKDFPNLNPGQLHHLLTNYQLCGKRRPDDWAPSEQESEQANELESIMESFNNHPPLVLPKGHCSIDLHKVPDPTFIDVWKNLQEEFKPSSEECVKESEMDLLLHRQTMTDNLLNVTPDDTVEVELKKGDKGLGLGLIDGLYTPLRSAGIYVRTLVAGGPAVEDGRLNVGDRILAVNGKGIVGADYQSAMSLIRGSGDNLKLLVAKGNAKNAMKVTSSLC